MRAWYRNLLIFLPYPPSSELSVFWKWVMVRSYSGEGLSWMNREEEKLERSYWDGKHLQQCWMNSQLARESQRAACGCWVMALYTAVTAGLWLSGNESVSLTGKHPIRGHLSAKLEVWHPWGAALLMSETYSEHLLCTTDWVASGKSSGLLEGLFNDTTGQRLGTQVFWLPICCPFYCIALLLGKDDWLFS